MASDLLRITGRIATGLLTAGTATVLVLGAALLPPPDSANGASGVPVSPTAAQQERVCAGPLVRLGDELGQQATEVGSFGKPRLSGGTIEKKGAKVTGLKDTDVTSDDGGTSSVVTAPAAESPSTLLGVSQAQVAATSDAAGLAAAECTEGAALSWLVAGATDTGRSTMLLLANPTRVPAVVDLRLYTADGPVLAPGLSDIVVPARAQRILSVAGFAPGQAQLAVSVTSRGGIISASLQQSIVRGLEPGGIDLVGRTTEPALEQIIPGVRITTSDAAEARAQVGGSQDVETVLRLLAPDANASVTIGVTGADGAEGTSLKVDAHAGQVLDVPLGPLADGYYSISLSSTAPVVASARASTVAPPAADTTADVVFGETPAATSDGIGFDVVGPSTTDSSAQTGERIDLAWFAAAGPLADPAVFVTARAASPRLSLTNSGDSPAAVKLTGNGDEQTLELAAGESVQVKLGKEKVYLLEPSAPVEASVSYAGAGALASHPVRAASPLAAPITVYR
ncbi:MAG: hypothetical protein JWR33_1116 [Naasia sp.]|uniref:DUF5719 family protein n=1 Tax=Naasia sp. TaxID=2546198 RepID=UPI00260D1BE1|nr:DUF5719 family protein [Naasia sp.]MCU1570375.1 hypothetical protein [Naasia sp.]